MREVWKFEVSCVVPIDRTFRSGFQLLDGLPGRRVAQVHSSLAPVDEKLAQRVHCPYSSRDHSRLELAQGGAWVVNTGIRISSLSRAGGVVVANW